MKAIKKPLSQSAQKSFQQWGKIGGKKRAQKLSSTQRQAIARQAAQKRWNSSQEKTKAKTSIRLASPQWNDPVYIEEVLAEGSVQDWRQLYHRLLDHPFGEEVKALEKVLKGNKLYGTTLLWKRLLKAIQGN